MFRSWFRVSSLAILLITSVIAPNLAGAATAPVIAALAPLSGGGLVAPTRLALDAAGNLYVSDARLHAVVKFDKFGRLQKTFKVANFTPEGLAVTADGTRLYVSARSSVQVLDGATGATLGELGAGAFERVGRIDLDEAGFVFVADRGKCQVVVYDTAGAQRYVIGAKGAADGQFGDVQALKVNVLTHEVLVADTVLCGAAGARVSVFAYDGTFKGKVTAFGVGSISQFAGLAVDGAGRVYVPVFGTDLKTGSMRILASTTVAPGYSYLSSYASQLAMPNDVAFDGVTGRFFVAGTAGRIEVYGVDGAQTPIFVNHAPGQPAPLSPVAGGEVVEVTPALAWQNAVDVDGDALTYNVKLEKDGVAVVTGGLSGQATNSAYRLVTPLEENQVYTWAVQASDGALASAYSEPQRFAVNAVQEAPGAPTLVSPAERATVAGSALLAWQGAVDPDPADAVVYQVQIAADPEFKTIVLDATIGGLSVALADLDGYQQLVDGATYAWRVRAVDNHGLGTASSIRSFTYDTTLLKVSANIPGASVFFYGNYAYAGKRLGGAPLELRDLTPGMVSVVVERSGFEPWVTQVAVVERQNLEVRAELVPALAPEAQTLETLVVANQLLALTGDAALFAVDFDSDGVLDLLTGDARGHLSFYRGGSDLSRPAFTASSELSGVFPAGAAPFVVDWNNDGKKDLLVGSGSGAVSLYLNVGSETQPAFAAGALLAAGGAPLNVGASAVPTVLDLNADGKKDLVVADGFGGVRSFLNVGSDAAPVLAAATELLPKFAGRVALSPVDWDADGDRDLLAVCGGSVSLYLRQADGSFQSQGALALPLASVTGSLVSVFAADLDGVQGKDLLLGSSAGEVVLLRAAGMTPVAAFADALLDAIDNLETVAQAAVVSPPSQLQTLRTALIAGDLATAQAVAPELRNLSTGDATVDQLLGEFVQLLR